MHFSHFIHITYPSREIDFINGWRPCLINRSSAADCGRIVRVRSDLARPMQGSISSGVVTRNSGFDPTKEWITDGLAVLRMMVSVKPT